MNGDYVKAQSERIAAEASTISCASAATSRSQRSSATRSYNSLRQELETLRSEYERLAQVYQPKYPKMQEMRDGSTSSKSGWGPRSSAPSRVSSRNIVGQGEGRGARQGSREAEERNARPERPECRVPSARPPCRGDHATSSTRLLFVPREDDSSKFLYEGRVVASASRASTWYSAFRSFRSSVSFFCFSTSLASASSFPLATSIPTRHPRRRAGSGPHPLFELVDPSAISCILGYFGCRLAPDARTRSAASRAPVAASCRAGRAGPLRATRSGACARDCTRLRAMRSDCAFT